MKYKIWLKEWLSDYVSITAKKRTILLYSEIVENHIIPKFGNCDLDSLSAIEFQKFVAGLLIKGNLNTGQGLSSSTINTIITIMQNSLSVAENIGIIACNPAIKLKRPKLVEKQVSCFSFGEQKKIEQAVLLDNRDYMFGVIICLYSGLRIGELLALEWQDIDFKNKMIYVTKTCYEGKDKDGSFGRIIDTPKTISSFRKIPVPKQIMPFLKEMKRNNKCQYVIAKYDKPLSIRTYQRYFATLLKNLNIEHKGFHALRHTFATRAIECGIDVKTLSELLGHKNPTITLNRYAHSLMEHKIEMMNKLGRLL